MERGRKFERFSSEAMGWSDKFMSTHYFCGEGEKNEEQQLSDQLSFFPTSTSSSNSNLPLFHSFVIQKIILKNAGTDATKQFDAFHNPGRYPSCFLEEEERRGREGHHALRAIESTDVPDGGYGRGER